jgi:hypothetical protein
VTSTDFCVEFRKKFLTFGLTEALQKRPQDRGFVLVVVDYLVGPSSLLHSDMLVGAIWLIIMAEICHYGRAPIFPFNDVNQPGLRHDCFDRSLFYVLENTSTCISMLQVVGLDRSSTSVFLFLSMYSTIKPLK